MINATYTFWLILDVWADGSTLYTFTEQEAALKRYLKNPRPSILYEVKVGESPSMREVMRKENEEEG